MDLIDRIKELSAKATKQRTYLETEEATKNAIIMPFLDALGYDVFNPLEVVPEFTADAGTKKGEKVDYAIKKDGEVIMLVECKRADDALGSDQALQLARYFSVTESRFGILTNGMQYQFYADLEEPNKMDSRPFFEFDLTGFDEHHVKELKKFTKSAFSLDDILTTASTLKYTRAVKKVLEDELKEPSENFVRFFISHVYDGRATQSVITQFSEIVREARKQFINEKINERLKSALNTDDEEIAGADKSLRDEEQVIDDNDGIETMEEEIEGYHIVKAILRQVVDVQRVFMRDKKSYCGILLDDNNRKPICRLHFNSGNKYLGLLSNKNEERVPIDNLNDIFKYADRIQATIVEYDQE
uniref:Type I restriction enzyme R protein N-terminal domain-containing protein n=1 Tax=Candidatus Kentrum sp. LFY TaxID=2126342 RepID=A0A450UUY1_9GAMM|nr:MAG: hypothetical protein BECKLFY1418B_GA0070995_10845 [Candidatus Kentron sp. LFY]